MLSLNPATSHIDWLKWNGVKSTDYGMVVLTQPTITRAAERVEFETIPGRSGSLTLLEDEDVYDDINLTANCLLEDPFGLVTINGQTMDRIDAICGWLRGAGEVEFANRQGGYYKARIANQIGFDKILRNHPHMGFPVQFRCQPFCYLYSGLESQQSTTSPITLRNPGNIYSEPLIKVTGTGEGAIVCGDTTLFISGFSGVEYMMLDCEAKIAYTGTKGSLLDPMILLNSRASGDWLRIPEGNSFLSWMMGITNVTVVPRWRKL